MKPFPCSLIAAALLVGMINADAAIDLKAFDTQLAKVAKFEYGAEDGAMIAVESTVAEAFKDEALRIIVERALLDTLSGDSTPAAKAFLCTQLRVVGTDSAVPHLKKLLLDKDLSHPARIALGGIGSQAAVTALLDSLASAEGKIAIGIVNTLGESGFQPAAGKISDLLNNKNTDRDLKQACVRALGLLGQRWKRFSPAGKDGSFTMIVARQLEKLEFNDARLQAAVHNARLRVANTALEAGAKAEAEAIYRALYEKAKAGHLRVAGMRGLVSAQARDVTDLLVKATHDDDSNVGREAVRLLAHSSGADATKLLALLPELPADRQPVLIPAIGRLGDEKPVPSILKYAASEDAAVRTAALTALGSLGGQDSVPILARAAGSREGDEARAARQALRRLPKNFDPAAALDALDKDKPEILIEAIKAFADSGTDGAQPSLVKMMTGHSDANVRKEALRALGKLATISTAGPLMKLLRDPGSADRPDVERALSQVIGRSAARNAAAREILALGPTLPSEARPGWVRLLVHCPTPESMDTVRKAAAGSDAEVADAAVRTLASWPTAEAADSLLAIARKPQKLAHKILALQGYVRLANDAPGRDSMYGEALKLAERLADKRVVLSGLANGQTTQALDLVEPFLDDAELREDAATAAIAIATGLQKAEPARVRKIAQQVYDLTKNKRTRNRAAKLLREPEKQ